MFRIIINSLMIALKNLKFNWIYYVVHFNLVLVALIIMAWTSILFADSQIVDVLLTDYDIKESYLYSTAITQFDQNYILSALADKRRYLVLLYSIYWLQNQFFGLKFLIPTYTWKTEREALQYCINWLDYGQFKGIIDAGEFTKFGFNREYWLPPVDFFNHPIPYEEWFANCPFLSYRLVTVFLVAAVFLMVNLIVSRNALRESGVVRNTRPSIDAWRYRDDIVVQPRRNENAEDSDTERGAVPEQRENEQPPINQENDLTLERVNSWSELDQWIQEERERKQREATLNATDDEPYQYPGSIDAGSAGHETVLSILKRARAIQTSAPEHSTERKVDVTTLTDEEILKRVHEDVQARLAKIKARSPEEARVPIKDTDVIEVDHSQEEMVPSMVAPSSFSREDAHQRLISRAKIRKAFAKSFDERMQGKKRSFNCNEESGASSVSVNVGPILQGDAAFEQNDRPYMNNRMRRAAKRARKAEEAATGNSTGSKASSGPNPDGMLFENEFDDIF